MAKYGLPYMGSKSGICDELIYANKSALKLLWGKSRANRQPKIAETIKREILEV